MFCLLLQGRDGKGNIYVMSAGNDGPRFNTNTFSLRNSIYAIVVSAVNARKEPPSYAPVGSSIMVVAYAGDDNLKVVTKEHINILQNEIIKPACKF